MSDSDHFLTLALVLSSLEDSLMVRLFSTPFQLISWTRPPIASCRGAPKKGRRSSFSKTLSWKKGLGAKWNCSRNLGRRQTKCDEWFHMLVSKRRFPNGLGFWHLEIWIWVWVWIWIRHLNFKIGDWGLGTWDRGCGTVEFEFWGADGAFRVIEVWRKLQRSFHEIDDSICNCTCQRLNTR